MLTEHNRGTLKCGSAAPGQLMACTQQKTWDGWEQHSTGTLCFKSKQLNILETQQTWETTFPPRGGRKTVGCSCFQPEDHRASDIKFSTQLRKSEPNYKLYCNFNCQGLSRTRAFALCCARWSRDATSHLEDILLTQRSQPSTMRPNWSHVYMINQYDLIAAFCFFCMRAGFCIVVPKTLYENCFWMWYTAKFLLFGLRDSMFSLGLFIIYL